MDDIEYILSQPLAVRLNECLRMGDDLADRSVGDPVSAPADRFDISGVEEMGAMLLLLCRDRSSYEITTQLIAEARRDLLSIEQPEAAAIAMRAVSFALGAGLSAARGYASGKIQGDAKKLVGLAERGKAKQAAQDRARKIAAELWQADAARAIRIGEMADRVYRQLTLEGFTEALPDTVERLKKWINPAAPDYARKGGKPRKTP